MRCCVPYFLLIGCLILVWLCIVWVGWLVVNGGVMCVVFFWGGAWGFWDVNCFVVRYSCVWAEMFCEGLVFVGVNVCGACMENVV